MIKSVKVTNYLGEQLLLELFFPERSGFIVTNIDGLGPGAAVINNSPYATIDGSRFISARSDTRNIVLSLIFEPEDGKTIEQKRHETYRFFPKKREVTLEIETDERIATIKGHIESNEPTIFSEQCGCTISIICDDPYFYSTTDNVTKFYGIEPLFEFPFEDPTSESPSLELSRFNTILEKIITYEGDSDVGMIFEIYLLGRVGNITIYNESIGTSMMIDVAKIEQIIGSQLQYGDTIVLTTVTGNKNIELIRDGVTYSILKSINVFDAEWFSLTQGDNAYAITAATNPEFLRVTTYNKVSYEGM